MGNLTDKERELCNEQREIIKDREGKIKEKLSSIAVEFIEKTERYYIYRIDDTAVAKELRAFLEGGRKPSEYFIEKKKLFAGWISENRLEDFYKSIDDVVFWQSSRGVYRRTVRTKDYVRNLKNIATIFKYYHEDSRWDCDVVTLLKRELSDRERAYLKNEGVRAHSYLIAAELDKGNKELEEYLEAQIMEDGSDIDVEMIKGIIRSKNVKLCEDLGKLLIAAQLQEGIRQAICENMDCGREEHFIYLLKIVIDENLIRFSSVARAAGTWTGLLGGYEYDVSRISKKQIELLYLYLTDETAKREALKSEDSVELFLALWVIGTHEEDDSFKAALEILQNGSEHQRLVTMFYMDQVTDAKYIATWAVENCENELPLMSIAVPMLARSASAAIENVYSYREIYDCCKIDEDKYRPLTRKSPELIPSFGDAEEYEVLYRNLKKILLSIPKKKMTFDPIIFPWYKTTLSKSDVIVTMSYIAAALKDEKRMEEQIDYLNQIEDIRAKVLALLTAEPKTEKQRDTVLAMATNPETLTRDVAFYMLYGMELNKEEYAKLEIALKSKKEDIRSKSVGLLMKQNDDDIKGTVQRLIDSSPVEKHLAALNLVMLLKNDEKRSSCFESCAELLKTLPDPTDQEKVLIKEITGKTDEDKVTVDSLYDDAATYVPVIDEKWVAECKDAFARVFPNSVLAQKSQGKKEIKDILKPLLPGNGNCTEEVKKFSALFKGLEDLIEENKDKEIPRYDGELVLLGNCGSITYNDDGERYIHLDEVWRKYFEKNNVDYPTLLKMSMMLAEAEETGYSIFSKDIIKELIGGEFLEDYNFKYRGLLIGIVSFFMEEKEDTKLRGKLAAAATHYLLYENKRPVIHKFIVEESRYDYEIGESKMEKILYHRSIFSHALLEDIMRTYSEYEEEYDKFFPLHYDFVKKAEYEDEVKLASGFRYYQHIGKVNGLSFETYIRAYALDIISKEYLLKIFWDEKTRSGNISAISNYVKDIRDKGRAIAKKRWEYNRKNAERDLFFKENDEVNKKIVGAVDMLYDMASTLIMESELKRGDAPTEFSKYSDSLKRIYGCDYFVRILVALGNSKLERSMYYSAGTRVTSLCHLLQVCLPQKDETVEDLKKALKGTKISEKRLIEAALYVADWNELVGEYLGWEGFTSCSYYFMAHMNEYFSEKRIAMIAKYTPISIGQLQKGAFDSNWFNEVYRTMGQKRFKVVYDACKYITSGSTHTRARKYADAALGNMNIEDTQKEIEAKRNKDLLMALGAIPSKNEDDLRDRYIFIKKFEKESKKFGAQRRESEKTAAELAVKNMATANGYQDSMRFILRMESKVAEGLVRFFEPKETEDAVVYLETGDKGKISIVCEKNGKKLKSVPAKLKKNEYIVEMTEAKKVLANQFSRAKEMFERAMEEETPFTIGELRDLTASPVISPVVNKIVFKVGDDFGFLSDFGRKKANTKALVAHPFHMYKAGVWREFQKRTFDEQIVQPFRQIFRELYIKTEDEKNCLDSRRFAGNQIQPKRTLGMLRSRGWIADIEDGLQKVYYEKDIIASIYAMADWFSPSDIEAPTLEWVVFRDRKKFSNIKIDKVPDIIFSEVMRDVDLVVSVAHAGGVDPEFSHSTIEMRKAIAEFTMPLFKLTNVTFTESHAKIKGTRGEYNVHLGSGVVHIAGGPMLNVLPVHSQRRGRIFLPFVDDDPKTAEVISKILLFAQDEKIKDPFILNQI